MNYFEVILASSYKTSEIFINLTNVLMILVMADTAAKSAAPAKKEKKPAAPKGEVKKAKEPAPVTPRPFKRYGRLWAKAVFTGYKRGLRNQHENHALLKVSLFQSRSICEVFHDVLKDI